MIGVVYLGNGRVETRELPTPVPGQGEVLVEMKAAGICGSDLHKYHNDEKWAGARGGMIAGHEPAGVVAETGPGVTELSKGDRVSVYHSLGCGRCVHCVRGEPVFCSSEGAFGRTRDGCHADFMTAPARFCLPLDGSLSFATGASLACTAGTAFAALRALPLVAGELLVVFGLGPVGMTALMLGQAMGYRGVGVEVNPYRVHLAERLGAHAVVNPGREDVTAFVRRESDGEGAPGIIECSGRRAAREQALQSAAMKGTVVAVGVSDEPFAFEANTLIRHELTVKGNAVYSMSDYYEAQAFVRAKGIALDDMITHRYRISEAVQAYEAFDGGQTGKVIFEW